MKPTCPICNSDAPYLFTSKHARRVYSCTNNQCQHLFTPPITTNQGVHERPTDIESESDNSLKLYRERNERLLQLFLNVVAPLTDSDHYTFLDFGAGDAHISRTFKSVLQEKVKVYCVEEEEKCIPLYHKYGLNHLKELQQIERQVDFAYAIEVIEHVSDPIAVLSSLKNVLKDHAQIFISTPPGHITESITNAYDNPTHLHFFTPLSLNLALTKAGLTEINYQIFSEMYPLPAINSLAEKIKAGTDLLQKRFPNFCNFLATVNQAVFKFINKIISRFFNKMQMPAAANYRPYPYHLVGFTKIS